MATPIFLISLPRSGSTMVQRLLSVSDNVATSSEPWVLLPVVYGYLRPGRIVSEYYQHVCDKATAEFVGGLENGVDDLYSAINEFARVLYNRSAKGDEKYFLDKTPRYHLIIPELVAAFPEAKFILLYRDLLDTFASAINFINKPHPLFGLGSMWIDLVDGVQNMANAQRLLAEKALVIRYESIVMNPLEECGRLYRFLEIDQPPGLLEVFSDISLDGAMGDKSGYTLYKVPDARSIGKWRKVIVGSYRIKLVLKWLDKLSPDDIKAFGKFKEQIISELKNEDNVWRPCLNDRLYYGLGELYTRLRLNMWFPGSRLYQRTKHVILR